MKQFTILVLALCLAASAASCRAGKKNTRKPITPAALAQQGNDNGAAPVARPAPRDTGKDSPGAVLEAFCSAYVAQDAVALLALQNPEYLDFLLKMFAENTEEQGDPFSLAVRDMKDLMKHVSYSECALAADPREVECDSHTLKRAEQAGVALDACATAQLHIKGADPGGKFEHDDEFTAMRIGGKWYMMDY